jgi:isopentenyldiphosphate isomerase
MGTAMSDELIEVWDWNTGKPAGLAVSRDEAHRNGIPHEGVHLWIVSVIDAIPHLLLQRRAANKEFYPGYFDITVGGHVLFGQTEGKLEKEAREELGIDLNGKECIDLGYFRYEEVIPEFSLFHREFQHIWLMFSDQPLESYVFYDNEVDALAAIPYSLFKKLLFKGKSTFAYFFDGKETVKKVIPKEDLHPLFFTGPMAGYMRYLVKEIDKALMQKGFSKSSIN